MDEDLIREFVTEAREWIEALDSEKVFFLKADIDGFQQRYASTLDEAIDLVAAALTGEFPEHDGARWKVRDLGLRPRPVQRPRPPIWVGGSTRTGGRSSNTLPPTAVPCRSRTPTPTARWSSRTGAASPGGRTSRPRSGARRSGSARTA